MLSILIPVYNFDIRPLLTELSKQASVLEVPCEIRCLDDGSHESHRALNRSVANLEEVWYDELSLNVGRSRVRNLLAEKAKFQYLLFLDCDGMPSREDFLQVYTDTLPTHQVVIGGRKYQVQAPDQPYMLHWLVGCKREASAKAGFQSNNFLINKSLFLSIRFDETLHDYGHEDTLFGYELKQRKVASQHIDNAVIHECLEPAIQYLQKQEQSLANLLYLRDHRPGLDTRLTRTLDRLRQWRLIGLFEMMYQTQKKRLKKRLLSDRPSLFWLDLYKLGYYHELQSRTDQK